MSVSTTDAWQSSPVAKRANGKLDGGKPRMTPLAEESDGDSDKKEAIEMTTVNVNNSANTAAPSHGNRTGDSLASDEDEPLLISRLAEQAHPPALSRGQQQ